MVTKSEFRNSGFTNAHLRGARFTGWTSTAVLVEHCARLVAAGERFVYAYYPGVDNVAHEFGLHDGYYERELEFADRLVADLLAVLPAQRDAARHRGSRPDPSRARRLDRPHRAPADGRRDGRRRSLPLSVRAARFREGPRRSGRAISSASTHGSAPVASSSTTAGSGPARPEPFRVASATSCSRPATPPRSSIPRSRSRSACARVMAASPRTRCTCRSSARPERVPSVSGPRRRAARRRVRARRLGAAAHAAAAGAGRGSVRVRIDARARARVRRGDLARAHGAHGVRDGRR